MKVTFNTGMSTKSAHEGMARDARKQAEHYSDKSAAHYTAWMNLAGALESAAEVAASANPGDPPPKMKAKLLR